MTTVRYELTVEQYLARNYVVPIAVQIRQILNANGFKFVDDGLPSAVVNDLPRPIGVLTIRHCVQSGSIIYEQTY